MTLALADNLAVSEVLPIDPTAIQPGTFVGTASLPGTDGTLAALEVLVFAESHARHRRGPFALGPAAGLADDQRHGRDDRSAAPRAGR